MGLVANLRALPAQIKQEWVRIPREERDATVTGLALLALGMVFGICVETSLQIASSMLVVGLCIEEIVRTWANFKKLEVERKLTLLVPGFYLPVIFPLIPLCQGESGYMIAAFGVAGMTMTAALGVLCIPFALSKQQRDIREHRRFGAAACLQAALQNNDLQSLLPTIRHLAEHGFD